MDQEASIHKFEVPKTARYFQLGELGPSTKHIWYVLHGYGQLGEYFIKHFAPLMDESMVVLAPEGLSRFYLDGDYDRVGATWMTRVDRLDEIKDQMTYLETFHQSAMQKVNREDVTLTLLGFSQGVATGWRWMNRGTVNPDNFILWAGSVPKDFPDDFIPKFREMNFYAVVGDEDQFISKENAEKYRDRLLEIHPAMKWFWFNGNHRMDAPTLAKVHQFIANP